MAHWSKITPATVEEKLKAFENDRSGRKMQLDKLKESIVDAQATEAIERRTERAFSTISNLIVKTPHNIVLKPAKIEPTK